MENLVLIVIGGAIGFGLGYKFAKRPTYDPSAPPIEMYVEHETGHEWILEGTAIDEARRERIFVLSHSEFWGRDAGRATRIAVSQDDLADQFDGFFLKDGHTWTAKT